MAEAQKACLQWFKARAPQWVERGILAPRHVRRILQEEGDSGPLPLPTRYAVRNAAIGVVGIALFGIGVWRSLIAGPAVLPWGARLIISLIVMFAGYAVALTWQNKETLRAYSPLAATVGLLAFVLAYVALAEGIGLPGGTAWALLLTGLAGVALAWFTSSRLLLVVSTLFLSGWMLELGWVQQRFNPWFPAIALVILLPLTIRLLCSTNLALLSVALPTWLGLATKRNFQPLELFLPFTLALWGILWVAVGERERLRTSPLADTWTWVGYVFLFGSVGFLSLHALGVSQAKAVLANPDWRLHGGLPLLVTNLLLSIGILALLAGGLRARWLSRRVFVGLGVTFLAVWVYWLFPESIPKELAGSLLPEYFLVTPFAFGLLSLVLLFGGAWHGYRTGDGFLLYLSLLGIAVLAGVRFFDSIWAVLPKTFFLYLNGIGLIVLWYLLEHCKADAEKAQ